MTVLRIFLPIAVKRERVCIVTKRTLTREFRTTPTRSADMPVTEDRFVAHLLNYSQIENDREGGLGKERKSSKERRISR